MEQRAPFETVTKLEVAERQLRVAIRLFFERRDMIAVHTLAAAAQGVLRDLGRRKGFMSIFEEGITNIRPEKRDEFKINCKATEFFQTCG
jgi:ribosomal protein S7